MQPVLGGQHMSGLSLGHGWWHWQELSPPEGEQRGRSLEPPIKGLGRGNKSKKGEEKHAQVIRRDMQQWSVTFLGAVSSLKTHAQKLSAIRRQKKRLGMVPTLKSIITKCN